MDELPMNQPDDCFDAEMSGFPTPTDANEDSVRDPLETLVTEFADRHRLGQNPSVDDYAERYPELADQIRDLFPLVTAMEQWKTATEATSLREGLPQNMDIQQLGDYQIVQELARGGMGVVFDARHGSTGKRVAVKLLPWNAAIVPRWRERFEREAETVRKLDHQHIVPVLDFGKSDGFYYYVMPFIEGVGLDWVIQGLRQSDGIIYADEIARLRAIESKTDEPDGTLFKLGNMDELEDSSTQFTVPDSRDGEKPSSASRSLRRHSWRGIARIGLQVADALGYAHRLGILHNDIKPANLLLDADGRVWVTDFGLAQPVGEDSDKLNDRPAGTVRYMAPERFIDGGDERSDIYSLGITLYELATLQPPWSERVTSQLIQQILGSQPKLASDVNPRIPHDFDCILMKAISRDPNKRYQSAAEFSDDLSRFVRGQPVGATRLGPLDRLRQMGQKWMKVFEDDEPL